MIESFNLFYMIQLGLLFVLFMTGAWKKSLTTLAFVSSLVIMFYKSTNCVVLGQGNCWDFILNNVGFVIVSLASITAVIRAILHKDNDIFIRHSHVQ